MKKPAQILVLLMAVEAFGASIAYAFSHNWKLSIYWLLVAALDVVLSVF